MKESEEGGIVRKSILIIDDEKNFLEMLKTILLRENYDVTPCLSARKALEILKKEVFDLCLCDIKMPEMDGLEFLKEIHKKKIELTVIMMSAYGTVETAIEAMKLGAYDYISKPFKPDEVILTLHKAEERENYRKQVKELISEVKRTYGFDKIIARSSIMMQLFSTIKKITEYKTTVLLVGESGTGKELVARAIHYNSPRSEYPFVVVNCGAIPENLLESELFGYIKGAFTDARQNKIGLFEAADKGTIFLDEIGELPLNLQVKLLRVLQDGEIRRVGDTKDTKVDVRIIAATIKNLEEEVNKGNFREDLYYRLNVVIIHIPPLRERSEDIPLLVEHFIRETSKKLGEDRVKKLSPNAMKALMDYHWPGNVRELENTIERAIILSDGDTIDIDSLPETVLYKSVVKSPFVSDSELSIRKNQQNMEIELIKKALQKTKGNKSKAAKILEISHRALLYKIKEYGIE